MKKFMPVVLAMILALGAFSVSAFSIRPAQAVQPGPQTRVLQAVLSGPAIDGVVPTANALFSASESATSLSVKATNINVPDGTVLTVALGGANVAQMTVFGGFAFVSLSPSPERVFPGELITISVGGSVPTPTPIPTLGAPTGNVLVPATGTVILTGTFQQINP